MYPLRTLVLSLSLLASAPFAAQAEQQLSLHLMDQPEALRLYDYLGQRAQSWTLDDFGLPLHYVGTTTDIGCSDYPECFLNVYEQEWKRQVVGDATVYQFILPIDQRTLTGSVAVGPGTLDLEIRDAVDGSVFHFNQPIACQADHQCSATVDYRNWPLPRRESQYVVENAHDLTLRFFGEEARQLYKKGSGAKIVSDVPRIKRVRLGSDLYCFEKNDGVKTYFCQALMAPMPTLSFAVSSFEKFGFSLEMRSTFQDLMLDHYDLIARSRSGKETKLKVCKAKSLDGSTDCNHWYDFGNDVSQPILDDLPGGIAVGWGRRPLPETQDVSQPTN